LKEFLSNVVSTMLRDGKHWRREERVQNNAHRHVKRNEMDTEEHGRVNSQLREHNVLNRHQMIESKRTGGIEIHMRSAAQENFSLTVASIDNLEPL